MNCKDAQLEMHVVWKDFARVSRQSGQGMVEYALILGFVVVISTVLFITRPELAEGIEGITERVTNLIDSITT